MSMDRDLSKEARRRPRIRRALLTGLALCIVLALAAVLRQRLQPSVEASSLRLGTVDWGPVEASVSATGHVIPAFEKVLSTPVDARVLKILRRPGAQLKPGDAIVQLDLAASRLEIDRLDERITQKRWELERREANFRNRHGELEESLEAARLDLEIATYRLGQQRRLFEEGLASEESQRQTEVEQRKAELAVAAAVRSLATEEDEVAADRRRQRLELDILGKERDAAARRLELATARSDRSGVLTWVVPEEGVMVERGSVLARIADLESYRVEASVSDIHAARLRPGSPTRVQVDGADLEGRIESVHPTIENGTVSFQVALDDPSHPALRNQLRVDVEVIVDRRAAVSRLPRSSFLPPGMRIDLFVFEEPILRRRTVETGLRGVDFIEVVDGLKPDDLVVLSDLRDYHYLDRLSIDGVPRQPERPRAAKLAPSRRPSETAKPERNP